jgi:aldose 1-epimerase
MNDNLIKWPFLTNCQGMRVEFCSVGASIYQIILPNHQRVTLANLDKETFLHSPFYYGKTIGRHSGRLVVPSYSIDGVNYPVKPYRSEQTNLHGGPQGISNQHFDLVHQTHDTVVFRYVSPSGEGDFPGELTLDVTYRLTDDNALEIAFDAATTAPTLCNLTNHVYFHFAQQPCQLNDVTIQMKSDRYLDIDEHFLIKGEKPSQNTPFSFQQPTNLGERLQTFEHHPLGGIDHYFFLNASSQPLIKVWSTQCPYHLEVTTTYPGVVMYTFNNEETNAFIEGDSDYFHRGFTLECQYPPGGIHHLGMLDSVLRPGQPYHHQTTYHFIKN